MDFQLLGRASDMRILVGAIYSVVIRPVMVAPFINGLHVLGCSILAKSAVKYIIEIVETIAAVYVECEGLSSESEVEELLLQLLTTVRQ